jgi:hypothetical protein
MWKVKLPKFIRRNYIKPEEKVFWKETVCGHEIDIYENKEGIVFWRVSRTPTDYVAIALPKSKLQFVKEKRYWDLTKEMAKENANLLPYELRKWFGVSPKLPFPED